MSKHLTALKTIMGGGIVSFHAVFAKALGSVNAGLMLSQAFFWQENSKFGKPVEIGGKKFFSKTCYEWYEETGISEESQKSARAKLKSCGILEEKLAGVPAKMHFHVNIEALVAVIHGYSEGVISVAVNHGNKRTENTRDSSGKFRQLDAVNSGNSYIESLESLESKERSGSPDVAIETLPSKKTKKEKSDPAAAPQQIIEAQLETLRAKYIELSKDKTKNHGELLKLTKQANTLKDQLEIENMIDQTILHLNEKAGFQYKLKTVEARRVIRKRLSENTLEEIFAVIDFKCREWEDKDEMRQYLRPSTLFNGHFEDYYQASLLKKTKPVQSQPANELTGIIFRK